MAKEGMEVNEVDLSQQSWQDPSYQICSIWLLWLKRSLNRKLIHQTQETEVNFVGC
jgi:hypothetical protein